MLLSQCWSMPRHVCSDTVPVRPSRLFDIQVCACLLPATSFSFPFPRGNFPAPLFLHVHVRPVRRFMYYISPMFQPAALCMYCSSLLYMYMASLSGCEYFLMFLNCACAQVFDFLQQIHECDLFIRLSLRSQTK